jgi:ketosteroid isomerase-like protein
VGGAPGAPPGSRGGGGGPRIRSTGQPYEVYFVQQFRFRDGKIAEIRQVASYCEVAPASG